MTTEEKMAVMQAFLDGKEIESRIPDNGDDSWEVNKHPGWTWGICEYRVKQLPEFKMDRDKYNRISKRLEDRYDLDELEVQQIIMEVGEIFGVTIKTE